jgi:hypothetical protein
MSALAGLQTPKTSWQLVSLQWQQSSLSTPHSTHLTQQTKTPFPTPHIWALGG